MRARFEYATDVSSGREMDKRIDERAAEGWRLHTAALSNASWHTWILIFERPVVTVQA